DEKQFKKIATPKTTKITYPTEVQHRMPGETLSSFVTSAKGSSTTKLIFNKRLTDTQTQTTQLNETVAQKILKTQTATQSKPKTITNRQTLIQSKPKTLTQTLAQPNQKPKIIKNTQISRLPETPKPITNRKNLKKQVPTKKTLQKTKLNLRFTPPRTPPTPTKEEVQNFVVPLHLSPPAPPISPLRQTPPRQTLPQTETEINAQLDNQILNIYNNLQKFRYNESKNAFKGPRTVAVNQADEKQFKKIATPKTTKITYPTEVQHRMPGETLSSFVTSAKGSSTTKLIFNKRLTDTQTQTTQLNETVAQKILKTQTATQSKPKTITNRQTLIQSKPKTLTQTLAQPNQKPKIIKNTQISRLPETPKPITNRKNLKKQVPTKKTLQKTKLNLRFTPPRTPPTPTKEEVQNFVVPLHLSPPAPPISPLRQTPPRQTLPQTETEINAQLDNQILNIYNNLQKFRHDSLRKFK
ncbi:mucin-2-like, partial [Leptopilina boulardi]|uniref:mucin-2-like n=1 Tax=Leptopilina boulardi TaxID=63433 RepID=UPI0021F56DC7